MWGCFYFNNNKYLQEGLVSQALKSGLQKIQQLQGLAFLQALFCWILCVTPELHLIEIIDVEDYGCNGSVTVSATQTSNVDSILK